jgi:sec-independent protein translocase protein TatB
MFEFGFGEMLLVAVVALLVLGPKRLPRAARTLGLWVRRARASWFSLRAELERELADEDLKASLREARDEVSQLRRELQAPLLPSQPASAEARPTVAAGAEQDRQASPP